MHPLLPIFHIFAAKSLVDLSYDQKAVSASNTPPKRKTRTRTKGRAKPPANTHAPSKLARRLSSFLAAIHIPICTTHLALLLLSVPASVYVVLFHCSAPVSVVTYLRDLPPHELAGGVGFLMPCHSTPWQAYLHRSRMEGRMWALGCEPPLG